MDPLQGVPAGSSFVVDVLGTIETHDRDQIYQPLEGPDSIRVLLLHPALDSTSALIGDLVIIPSLSNTGAYEYTALSYVWGEQRDAESLDVNGRHLAITKNLASALAHLRCRDRQIYVWADAICINQADLTERNLQVQRMRNIFSNASETVIYLGDEDGNTCYSAWNYLERHSSWAMDANRNVQPTLPLIQEERISFRGDLGDIENDVLKRSWFRRVWVFQEAVVSKNLSIQCGDRRISWDDFCKILLLSPRYHDRYGLSSQWSSQIEIVRDMFQARCSYLDSLGSGDLKPPWHSQVQDYKGTGLDIVSLLARARKLQTSDPRDKIFALLGISRDVDLADEKIAINYRKSCSEVYINFSRYHLETNKSYDLLSYIDRGLIYSADMGVLDWYYGKNSTEVSEDNLVVDYVTTTINYGSHVGYFEMLPSWVPNWNRGVKGERVAKITRTILSTMGEDDGRRVEQRKHLVKKSRAWTENSNNMVCVGSIIGEIDYISPKISIRGMEEIRFQHARDRLASNCEELYRKIIQIWNSLLTDLESDWWTRSDAAPHPIRDGHLWRLFSKHPQPKRNSVEGHLFQRARKTATWTDDNNMAATEIIDESSIVDGKCIGVYCSNDESDGKGLALLPVGTLPSDFIVYLRGAQVPFIVREISPEETKISDKTVTEDKPVQTSNINDSKGLTSMTYRITGVALLTTDTPVSSLSLFSGNAKVPFQLQKFDLGAEWSSKIPGYIYKELKTINRQLRSTSGSFYAFRRVTGFASLPTGTDFGDLVISFMGKQVPFFVLEISPTVAPLDKNAPELVNVRKQLSIRDEISFLKCKIIGECVINGFEDIEERHFSLLANAAPPNELSKLSGKSPDLGRTDLNGLIDCAFIIC